MICRNWLYLALVLGLTVPAALLAQGLESGPPPRLVGYFPQWGLYNQPQYVLKDLVADQGAAMLSQINYAQAFVTGGQCSIADRHADLDLPYTVQQSVDGLPDDPAQPIRGGFNQLLKLRRQYPRLKLVISLEGRASDFAADAATPAQRETFVASCVKLFLQGHLAPGIEAGPLFDGIDVDWEYPGLDHRDDFLALLAEFRRQMDALRPGLLLTIAVGPSPQMAGGIDLTALGRIVDQVGLMTYDMAGPWSKVTGFHAPLRLPDGHPGGSGQQAVEAFVAAGIPPQKLLLGVPFYGYAWNNVQADANGLFQQGQGMRGDYPYSEIAGMTSASKVYRDPGSQAPWLYNGNVFWTYDDPVSIRFKGQYIRQQGLGGLMAWELGEDSPTGDLLRAAYEGLGNVNQTANDKDKNVLTPDGRHCGGCSTLRVTTR